MSLLWGCFPQCESYPLAPLLLRALGWCLLFRFPPDVFLKTNLVLFSKLGGIRYILHLENMFLFLPCLRRQALCLLWFSLWSFQLVIAGPIHLVMLCMPVVSSTTAIYLPRTLSVEIKLRWSVKTGCFFLAKENIKEKDPDSSEIPYFRALNY